MLGLVLAGVANGIPVRRDPADALVVATQDVLPIGTLLRFEPNYAALLRAMTSPFVAA